jgi:acetyl-CoA carboxylase, biotin carboxylase subunit
MFSKILIANRGEIAMRVIAACKDLGIKTVAIYSEADRHGSHVQFADEHVCVGPARASASYLDIPSVLSAALITKADAIHPGYGFLSENADFAESCSSANITFIGPKPSVMRQMGLKQEARLAMAAAGIPILPGSQGVLTSDSAGSRAAEMAFTIGYPVLIKASAGGGGRGMRIVREPGELTSQLTQASQEAVAAFGNGDVYLEKLLERPRHIEFQVLADQHGDVRVLGERECSIQRRHQKLIEESPSPAMNEQLRATMSRRVAEAMTRVGYTNAGTVEFLMDESGALYFIEVNARIQVEHPVTEYVTGTDLVKSQILIAAGERLSSILPADTGLRGHALECRINAEDPETFRPSPGVVTVFQPPNSIGVRVETALYTGAEVSPHYDSLIAKVITHGRDRTESIARMRRALSLFGIEGIQTSIPFHQRILAHSDFLSGRIDTGFLARL